MNFSVKTSELLITNQVTKSTPLQCSDRKLFHGPNYVSVCSWEYILYINSDFDQNIIILKSHIMVCIPRSWFVLPSYRYIIFNYLVIYTWFNTIWWCFLKSHPMDNTNQTNNTLNDVFFSIYLFVYFRYCLYKLNYVVLIIFSFRLG